MPVLLQQEHGQMILIYLRLLILIPKLYNPVSILATNSDQFALRRQRHNNGTIFEFLREETINDHHLSMLLFKDC
jgi:hypothetical protein